VCVCVSVCVCVCVCVLSSSPNAPKFVVTLLLHCCFTAVTLLLHRYYTVVTPAPSSSPRAPRSVTLLSRCCHAVVTLLLHCCYTVVTLLSHCCLLLHLPPLQARGKGGNNIVTTHTNIQYDSIQRLQDVL
jgi:hypothetical protein